MATSPSDAGSGTAVVAGAISAVDVATSAAAQLLRNGFAANAGDAMIDHAISGIPAALHQKV